MSGDLSKLNDDKPIGFTVPQHLQRAMKTRTIERLCRLSSVFDDLYAFEII